MTNSDVTSKLVSQFRMRGQIDDLFAIDPAEIKAASEFLCEELQRVSKPRTAEVTLRIAFQSGVEEVARRLGLTLTWTDEFRLIEGRADTVYGGLVIEYEPACSLRPSNKSAANVHAIAQVRDYIAGLHRKERHKIERYAGVVCDGCFFIFLRSKESHWHVEPPAPVTVHTCDRFLRYLFALQTELATTPENLLRDFGDDSACARETVRVFYEALITSDIPKIGILYRQWSQTFSEICGYEPDSPKLNIAKLCAAYGIKREHGKAAIDPFKLFFAIHTYYGMFIKLLAVQIIYFYARRQVTRIAAKETVTLAQAAALDSKSLLGYLVDLEENGGIFGRLGIRNFLEGDFFGWPLECWNGAIESALREIIRKLSDYSFVTLDTDPEGTRDLLKKLYQNLMPQELRHDLGEYYTPDWLAEQVLNQLHGGTPDKKPRSPQERLLDPACGSGTFLVLHIRDVRQYAREQLLPQKKITRAQLLERILTNVVGYDLNPLAAISARTNYLLALGDLLDEITDDIDIPIYLADSVLTPSEGTELETLGKFSFRTAVGRFSLPRSLIKADYIDELANLLESCVKARNSSDVFRKRLCATFPLDEKRDATDIATVETLFSQLAELDRQHINGIWARIIKNAFAPLFQPLFDYVAGNPPWINWANLPDEYRQHTAPLWAHYRLFEHKGLRARTGAAMDDLSVLMLYVSADKYLKKNGRLGFVITQSIFKTEGGGEGFRRLRLGDQDALRVLQVDDFSLILQKGNTTRFPVPYNFWRKLSKGGISTEADHDEAMEQLRYSRWVARPVSPTKITSPWLTGRPRALSHLDQVIGQSDYVGRYGSHTHLNGVYWMEITTTRGDGTVLISNLHDVGKRKVTNVNATIESDFVFPLLRGRDVHRWSAKPSCEILIPQDPKDPAKGYPEKEMQERFPKTYAYLKQFERQLRERSGFKQFFDVQTAPFYSVYNVGEYTFSPYKVCWREVASDVRAATCSSIAGRVITFDHILVGVSCQSESEAHFICALLNSTPANFVVRGYVTLHPSPSILKYIRIPKFDAKERLHTQLAESSEACHAATASGDDSALESLEARNNSLAAEVWKLSNAELKEIENSLADLV